MQTQHKTKAIHSSSRSKSIYPEPPTEHTRQSKKTDGIVGIAEMGREMAGKEEEENYEVQWTSRTSRPWDL